MIMPIIILFSILLNLTGCGDYARDHIDADDNGEGKSVKLIVKPTEKNGLILRDDKNNVALKWQDTGLIISNSLGGDSSSTIGLSVKGRWYPFGTSDTKKECEITTCGETSDTRCFNLPSDTPTMKQTDDNIGCYLSQGNGVYLLISKDGADPNINPSVANSPNVGEGFYAAHIGNFQMDKNGMITIDKVWSCDDSSGMVSCQEMSIGQLTGGKVYLKIYDGYYGDNAADLKDSTGDPYVLINITKGVIYPNFVSESIKIIVSTIDSVSQRVSTSIVESLKKVAFLIILLYWAFTGFTFMIGMAKITQTEALVRLLKIGIVLMFMTPNNIIATGFTHMYQEMANLSSNIITQSLVGSNIQTTNDGTDLENSLDYLIVYDGIINQILSRQVHLKIWALLLTWNFWFIPFLYVLIVMIIFIVLRSLLLYVTAYVQIAFLILILPILVPTLLFQTTADIFQSWLKYMANSALLIVVATLGFGIVLGIMLSTFGTLLSYSITKTWWWFPDNNDSVGAVLNFKSYLTALIQALICYAFIEVAPKLADALSESQLSPSLNAFNSLWHGMSQMMNEGISNLKSFNNQYLMGRLMDQAYKTDGKYDRDKEGKGVLNKWRQGRDAVSKFYDRNVGKKIDKISNKINDNSLINFSDPYKDQAKKDQLADLRGQNEKEHTTYGDYKQMIDGKKKEYLEQVKSNSSLINDVQMPDGTQIQLDGNGNDTISYDGQNVSKAEIRQAIAEGRDAKSVDGTNIAVQHNPQPGAQGGYDALLNDRLKGKLDELGKIEKDYGFVKRK